MNKEELKKWIDDNIIDKTGRMNVTKTNDKYIQHHYLDIFNQIVVMTSCLPMDITSSERMVCFYLDIVKVPICKICGNKVKFMGFKHGYQNYCSIQCGRSDPETLEKSKKTC
jgi:hypothetical protein